MKWIERQIIWKSLAYEGLEHVYIQKRTTQLTVLSSFIGVIEGNGFQLNYQLSLDRQYRIREAALNVLTTQSLTLIKDKAGNWSQRETLASPTQPLPEFDSCIDIDITVTPFTNTLPIRRIDWQVGQSEAFKMLYITVPELTLSVSRQRYTCLEKSAEGALFRFELIDGDFEALLPVDADGLVIDYPGLFKRVWASDWNVEPPR